jgi:hypothetical protein
MAERAKRRTVTQRAAENVFTLGWKPASARYPAQGEANISQLPDRAADCQLLSNKNQRGLTAVAPVSTCNLRSCCSTIARIHAGQHTLSRWDGPEGERSEARGVAQIRTKPNSNFRQQPLTVRSRVA